MSRLLACLPGAATMLYPFVVYYAIDVVDPWKIAAVFMAILSIRLFARLSNRQWDFLLLTAGIIYCGLAIWQNSELSLRFYPVLIDFCLLFTFAASLVYPPPIIERIARLQHPDLPDQGIKYTRKVTQIWCLFFTVNGLVALATALWGSFYWWSLYNGFISYVLIALLMGVEYLVRIRTQEHVR